MRGAFNAVSSAADAVVTAVARLLRALGWPAGTGAVVLIVPTPPAKPVPDGPRLNRPDGADAA